MSPHMGGVFDHFNNSLTSELKKLGIRSLLYIGWRSDCSPWWWTRFTAELGVQRIGILEIYAPNYEDAKRRFPQFVNIHGDARKIEEAVFPGEFDMIYWDHGPEHVSKEDLVACTPKLFDHAGKILLYSCPWGNWPQGGQGGNDMEQHYDVDAEALVDLGMQVIRFGGPGQQNGGELIAYKVHE